MVEKKLGTAEIAEIAEKTANWGPRSPRFVIYSRQDGGNPSPERADGLPRAADLLALVAVLAGRRSPAPEGRKPPAIRSP